MADEDENIEEIRPEEETPEPYNPLVKARVEKIREYMDNLDHIVDDMKEQLNSHGYKIGGITRSIDSIKEDIDTIKADIQAIKERLGMS